jgi:hypothetical protein
MKRKINIDKILVAISDTHIGCQLGLCSSLVFLDNGGEYKSNRIQKIICDYWKEFWEVHVPEITGGLPYCVVVNGDTTDGNHHNATHQITHNLTDQAKMAYDLLKPIVEKCEGRFYMIRGTEAHVGKSGQEEERLAKELGAIPNRYKQYARNDLWKKVGSHLVHIAHHIGTTGSAGYESTAVHKEMTEAFIEAARWGERPPDMIIRSHRHRYFETSFATKKGRGRSVVTPGWQAKTPFAYRVVGGRQSQPQFGGVVIIESPTGELYTIPKVWSLDREEAE